MAIGECGLDYFRITEEDLEIKNKQKEIFLQQIKLAKEVNVVLVVAVIFPAVVAVVALPFKFPVNPFDVTDVSPVKLVEVFPKSIPVEPMVMVLLAN